MVGRNAAAAEPVGEHRHAQRLRRHPQRVPRPREVHVGPGDDRRTLCTGDQRGRALHLVVVGFRASRHLRIRNVGIRVPEHDVEREVAEHGAAVRHQRLSRQRVDQRGDLRDVGGGCGALCDGGQHRYVIELLQ